MAAVLGGSWGFVSMVMSTLSGVIRNYKYSYLSCDPSQYFVGFPALQFLLVYVLRGCRLSDTSVSLDGPRLPGPRPRHRQERTSLCSEVVASNVRQDEAGPLHDCGSDQPDRRREIKAVYRKAMDLQNEIDVKIKQSGAGEEGDKRQISHCRPKNEKSSENGGSFRYMERAHTLCSLCQH